MATDMTVANEIARQIGGRAFFMMGTKIKTGTDTALMFDIKGCKRFNWVRVTLAADDTYTVEFIHIGRAPAFKTNKETFEGIYNDQLHSLISEKTGLALSL